MARVGLSKPRGAVYTLNNGSIEYGTITTLGKAVELDLSLDSASDNILYADNAPAESDNQFAGGTLELTTDELSATVMGLIYGITPSAIGTSTTQAWYKFNDSQNTPYMGFGAVLKKIVGGAVKYQAIVYKKIQFQNMDEALTTQGETIEWGTPTISATILRDDSTTHDWKWVSTDVDTEAEALALVDLALTTPV